MSEIWRVSKNIVGGKAVYGVCRTRDPEQPDHSGNREVHGYYDSQEEAERTAETLNRPEGGTAELPIESIRTNPLNPRKNFDAGKLLELAQSIGEIGLLQPIVVECNEPEGYLLLAGERRLKACKMIGLTHVSAIIRTGGLEPRDQMALMLIENLQRDDLDPIEEARAFASLTKDHGLSQPGPLGRLE